MSLRMNILVIGSANADLVIHTDRMPHLGETIVGRDLAVNAGGKGLNQAVAIAKLGGEFRDMIPYTVPGDPNPRYFLIIQKKSLTPRSIRGIFHRSRKIRFIDRSPPFPAMSRRRE